MQARQVDPKTSPTDGGTVVVEEVVACVVVAVPTSSRKLPSVKADALQLASFSVSAAHCDPERTR